MAFTNQDVADVLERALALMNNSGRHWIQGFFHKKRNGEVCYCAVGAIRAAAPGDQNRKLRQAAYTALLVNETVNRRWGSDAMRKIMSWNDSPSTSWKDVQKVFRNARKTVLRQKVHKS